MWFQDIQAKKDKEDREARKVYERNREVSAILKDQMKILEDQKFEENRLRVENARLLVNKCFPTREFINYIFNKNITIYSKKNRISKNSKSSLHFKRSAKTRQR